MRVGEPIPELSPRGSNSSPKNSIRSATTLPILVSIRAPIVSANVITSVISIGNNALGGTTKPLKASGRLVLPSAAKVISSTALSGKGLYIEIICLDPERVVPAAKFHSVDALDAQKDCDTQTFPERRCSAIRSPRSDWINAAACSPFTPSISDNFIEKVERSGITTSIVTLGNCRILS